MNLLNKDFQGCGYALIYVATRLTCNELSSHRLAGSYLIKDLVASKML